MQCVSGGFALADGFTVAIVYLHSRWDHTNVYYYSTLSVQLDGWR